MVHFEYTTYLQWAVLKVTETGFTKMRVTALIIVRLL